MADQPPPLAVAAPRRLRWSLVPLCLVWSAAAVPVALWLVHRNDPELAVRCAQVGQQALGQVLLALSVLAAVGALVFPPLPAAVRLLAHRARLSVASDRGPLLRALAELRHFESAAKHLEVGRLALQRSELQIAGPHLQRATELDPQLAGAHHQFGLFLFRIGQLRAALTSFGNAAAVDPGHAFGDALLYRGRCVDLLGEHAEAARILQEHARTHGGSRRSHYWLGLALAAAGDAAGAEAAFAEAAAPPKQRLTAEENWFRALARVRRWRARGAS